MRDKDGEAIRVQARPDLVEDDQADFAAGDPRQVTPEEVEAAIAEAFLAHDRARLAELDLVLVETMPEHLRATHEAAHNRGRWPHNGAERFLVPRAAAGCGGGARRGRSRVVGDRARRGGEDLG